MPKKRPPAIGSISTGSLLAEDTIPAFMDELRAIRGAVPRELYDEIRAARALTDETERRDTLLDAAANKLVDALSEHAPPYCYFGTHVGDAADFGFWLSNDALRDFEGLRVSDTSEVPPDYCGEVLHVNDHGNATLYSARKGSLRLIWAVV